MSRVASTGNAPLLHILSIHCAGWHCTALLAQHASSSASHFGASRKVGSVRIDSANVGNPVPRIRMNRVASTCRFFQRFSARFLSCIAFVCHSGGHEGQNRLLSCFASANAIFNTFLNAVGSSCVSYLANNGNPTLEKACRSPAYSKCISAV